MKTIKRTVFHVFKNYNYVLDQAMCPSCLLGPGESCSNWKGKCGDELKCRYSSAFESIGTCVLESEFNSRKEGESCGYYEGECGEGLKCQSDVDILSYFCGMDEAGENLYTLIQCKILQNLNKIFKRNQ